MDKRSLNRRDFLRLSAAATAGAIVAGCGPTPTPQVVEKVVKETVIVEGTPKVVEKVVKETVVVQEVIEKVTIDFWWGWTPDIHVNAITAAVRKFEEYNPNITVRTAQHGWGPKVPTALAAGTPPDLFVHDPPAQFAAKGSLLSLDDYMNSSKIANSDAFLEASLREGSWKGKVYGIPGIEHFTNLGTGMNKRLAAEAGLKVPDDIPLTWEDCWDQTVKYSKLDDAGNVKLLWYAPSIQNEWWPWVSASYGFKAYDDEQIKFNFDNLAWIEALEWVARYYNHFGPDKVEAFYEAYPGWTAAAGNAMASGVQAARTSGYWQCGELAKTAPNEHFGYSWAPVPSSRKGKKVQAIGINFLMIPKDARTPDAAWQLAEFLTTNESVGIVYKGTGFLLATKAFLKDPASVVDVTAYEGLDWYIESLTKADEVVEYPACPVSTFVTDQWIKAVDAVIYKEKTAEQAVADLQKNSTEELAKAIAPA